VRTRAWPLPHLVDGDDEQRLLSVLRLDNWSNGELTREFENRFAVFCGSKHALLVNNGTAALKLTLLALGVGLGDEVIVPGMTWPSVPIAVIECGADPVPAEIDNDTYGLSLESVREAITSRTKVIIPTHLFCSQTELAPIVNLVRREGIYLIEDASHAVGAKRCARRLGSLGKAGIFSFNQKKLLACGEGGCLVTDDENLYERAKSLREIDPESRGIPSTLPATNMVSEFQSAVLLSQLEKLPSKLSLIEQRAELLRSLINGIEGVETLARPIGTELQTFYYYCFKVAGTRNISAVRNALAAELALPMSGAYRPLCDVSVVNTALDLRYPSLGTRLSKRLTNCLAAHYSEAVRFHHRALLSDESAMSDIAEAIYKVVGILRRGC